MSVLASYCVPASLRAATELTIVSHKGLMNVDVDAAATKHPELGRDCDLAGETPQRIAA
jgi:hypothetical protein